jgi:hypothetical protein
MYLFTLKPRVQIPEGTVVRKYQNLTATLAPLIVLGIAGILGLLIAPKEWLYLLIFFTASVPGNCAADINQSLWLLRFPDNHLFRIEKQGEVAYGP